MAIFHHHIYIGRDTREKKQLAQQYETNNNPDEVIG
jgi:hypothetical protein